MQRGFRLRLVEVLTLTGAPPIVERGQQRGGGEARHDVIGVRAEGSGGRAIGPSGEIVKAGNGGGHVAEARQPGLRPALAHQAGAQHDDVRLDLAQGLVIEAQVRNRAGRERLGDRRRPSAPGR